MELLARIRGFAHQHTLFRSETRVAVALSGGSDSVALAALLRELHAAGDLRLVGAAHFNHQLRDSADRDEHVAADVAERLGLPYVADREDVRARARRDHHSLEVAARAARYAFFERARAHFAADVIALGHTRDDQAETYLLRLLRGAGPRGLASMYPRHGAIVRPALDCRRAELRDYLDRRGLRYVEDETNFDLSIARNRIRSELMPLLASRFNPAVVDALAREADLARETWAWLESAAAECAHGADGLDVERLRSLPAALRRLVLWRAMRDAAGHREVGFGHVEAALRLLDVDRGGVDAPGHRVQRFGGRLVLSKRADAAANHPASPFQYPLAVPGEVRLPEAGCSLAAEVATAGADMKASARTGTGSVAIVRRDLCQGDLAVRNRRAGDQFRPVGVGGRKKLQDYFVDRKVDRARRDRVPLVVDASDRIVWVAGYGIDEVFRVTDPSQSVLLLRLSQA